MSQPINLATRCIFYYLSYVFCTVTLLLLQVKTPLVTELISLLTIPRVCCPLHHVQILSLTIRKQSTQNSLHSHPIHSGSGKGHTEGPEEIIANKDFNSVFQEKAWNEIICGQK